MIAFGLDSMVQVGKRPEKKGIHIIVMKIRSNKEKTPSASAALQPRNNSRRSNPLRHLLLSHSPQLSPQNLPRRRPGDMIHKDDSAS